MVPKNQAFDHEINFFPWSPHQKNPKEVCGDVFPQNADFCFAHPTSKGKFMNWTVYLSGEIHSDWRDQITIGSEKAGLPISFLSPVTVHEDSDNCGVEILGAEENNFWKDHKGAMVNAISTRAQLKRADIVVVRFGDKYKQWNAAFDAGYAAALGKSLIVLHDKSLIHPLKEVDAAALAIAETPEQVVRLLTYAVKGIL